MFIFVSESVSMSGHGSAMLRSSILASDDVVECAQEAVLNLNVNG